MGKHRGYRVSITPNGTWKAWPWDPHSHTYAHIKSGFRTESEAKKYAATEHARFLTKLEVVSKAKTRYLADEYLRHLGEVKKRSLSHLANVRRAMNHLVKACPDPQHPRAGLSVEAYIAGLEVSANTKIQFVVTIKALGNWSVRKGLLPRSPWVDIETEEAGDPLKEQFTIDELRQMVLAIDDPYWFDACTFIYTGMRSGESALVMREAIDLGGGVMTVIGKGRGQRRKERLVQIQHEYRALLDLEMQTRPTGPLARISPKQQRKRFPQFLQRLGITKGRRTVHSWRHGYAGLQTATGASASLVGDYLGHKSQKTTRHYSALAARYHQAVSGWPRGEFQLLTGAASRIEDRPAIKAAS